MTDRYLPSWTAHGSTVLYCDSKRSFCDLPSKSRILRIGLHGVGPARHCLVPTFAGARLSLLFDGTPESGQRPISFKDFSTALNGGTGASAKDSAAPKGFGVKAKPGRAACAVASAMAPAMLLWSLRCQVSVLTNSVNLCCCFCE
eukprot:1153229-Pelagomonas_calceolata.AAC.6